MMQDSTGRVFGEDTANLAKMIATQRKRLLDLSPRNRLINYKFPRGRSLRFARTGAPDYIFDTLIEGGAVVIKPVPDPSNDLFDPANSDAISTATRLGIPVEYDWGALAPTTSQVRNIGGNAKTYVQAILYSEDLDALLRRS